MAVRVKSNNKWHLRHTEKVTSKIIMHGLEDLMDEIEENIKQKAPGSIGQHTSVTVGLRKVIVTNDHEAAQFVEFGTPAHKIEASPGGVLRWFDDAGNPIFAKSVNHPGTDPNPFFRNAIDDALDNIPEHFKDAIRSK